jgi:predicted kinase
MAKLVIMRGLPASGKTTLAKEWVREDPDNRVRVNRDDLRAMAGVPYSTANEQRIIRQRDLLIDEFLCRGNDVINDDTNLPQRTVRDLAKIAKRTGAEFEVIDLTHVDLDECLKRNAGRGHTVPDTVIQTMWMKYINGKKLPLPVPDLEDVPEAVYSVYVPDKTLRSAYIFDIDGTVAHMNGRSPYDYTRVSEDLPDEETLHKAEMLRREGHYIIFLSGRKDTCFHDTYMWLRDNLSFDGFGLIMRDADDNRRDSIVKYELFGKLVRDNYYVRAVFDDRQQVVDMWRKIGLKVYQCEPGDF